MGSGWFILVWRFGSILCHYLVLATLPASQAWCEPACLPSCKTFLPSYKRVLLPVPGSLLAGRLYPCSFLGIPALAYPHQHCPTSPNLLPVWFLPANLPLPCFLLPLLWPTLLCQPYPAALPYSTSLPMHSLLYHACHAHPVCIFFLATL